MQEHKVTELINRKTISNEADIVNAGGDEKLVRFLNSLSYAFLLAQHAIFRGANKDLDFPQIHVHYNAWRYYVCRSREIDIIFPFPKQIKEMHGMVMTDQSGED